MGEGFWVEMGVSTNPYSASWICICNKLSIIVENGCCENERGLALEVNHTKTYLTGLEFT